MKPLDPECHISTTTLRGSVLNTAISADKQSNKQYVAIGVVGVANTSTKYGISDLCQVRRYKILNKTKWYC